MNNIEDILKDYLTIINDNKYCHDLKLISENINPNFMTYYYYYYEFKFAPFKNKFDLLDIKLHIDIGSNKPFILVDKVYGKYKVLLRSTFFNTDYCSVENFKHNIENCHKIIFETIDNLYNGKSKIYMIKTFLSEETINEDDYIRNMYNSLTTINKYKL